MAPLATTTRGVNLPDGSSLSLEARARVRAFFGLGLGAAPEGEALPRWDLVCGESLALLTRVPSGSVQSVSTDSPYSSVGMFRGDRAQSTGTKYVTTETHAEDKAADRFVDFAGDSRDQRSFTHWCALWMAECYRCADDGALGSFWTDWRQIGATVDAMQAGGWVYRGIFVWDKTAGVRPRAGGPRQQGEFVAWGSKGAMRPERVGGRCEEGLVRCASTTQTKRGHQTGKPDAAVRPWVRLTPPGGILLDPFAGGAGIADVLIEEGEGRRYLGFEVVPRIHGEAHQRLSARTGAPVAEGAAIAGDGQKHGRRKRGASGGANGDGQLLLGEAGR